jgi:transglutaminase-like putative cysteine protease
MTRYQVRHTTVYAYSWAVDLSQHVLHLTPRDRPRQRVRSSRIVTEPSGYAAETVDYFGNAARYLEISGPHNRFEVTLTADVEVEACDPPADEATPAWERVRDMLADDGFPEAVAESEFALPSPLAAADAAMVDYARLSFAKDRPILAGLRDLTRRIYKDFRYDPAATEVFTAVGEVMAKRAGVCQDFAHLQIAMLRGLGLAARYVSGYIRTYPSDDGTALRGADASHAWISAWCGPDHGWIDFDPTNNLVVSDEHVVLAVGRDYADLSPIRGVVLGGGPHSVEVAVQLTAL